MVLSVILILNKTIKTIDIKKILYIIYIFFKINLLVYK